jgi:isopentenyldiphosphate isomerase
MGLAKGDFMEHLDIYDEYMNKIGQKPRDIVHQNGLWHKTVHCWMYDDNGNIYFQIRADSGKLYTTASGHVLAGETVRDAFQREIHEEIGLSMDASDAIPLEIVFWRQDKPAKNWHDRAFAHIYANKLPTEFTDFHFQPEEVTGLVRINAKACLDLLMDKKTSVRATKITADKTIDLDITKNDFLVAPNETPVIKYGFVLQSIIQQNLHI